MGGSFFAQHGPHRQATPPSHGLARVHALHFRAAGARSYNRERGSPAYLPTIPVLPGLSRRLRDNPGIPVLRAKIPVFSREAVPR